MKRSNETRFACQHLRALLLLVSACGCASPLHNAVQNGESAQVRELVARGADVREMRNGRIALVEAVRRGEDESALILIETGSDTDFLEMREGSPFARPLFYAASRGNAALVKALLNANAGVDAAGYNGMTPLMEAARSGQEEVLRLLLESGAKIESVDNIGRTALIWAAIAGHENCITALMKAGADTETRDDLGRSAAAYALLFNRRKIFALLRGTGKNKSQEN